MKKIICILTIFLVIFVLTFSISTFAASLGSISVGTDKTFVHPNENVKVSVDFGVQLGSYTVDVAYDNNLFEYVSTDGGTANDNGTRVRVYYFDQTGGSNPRNNMSITFKAKSGIITSNPTNFAITAEGLASADASISYDDITTPISTEVVVEPNYVDYDINLTYTGDVVKNEKKDMKLTISSSIGRNYEHTRIVADVVTPEGATAKLLGTDEQGTEYDIIQSGWGDATGDPIGGKDVVKELNVQGLFDKAGEYKITFKLIDKDNSDEEIAHKNVSITVKDETTTTPDDETTEGDTGNNNNSGTQIGESQKEPTTLPQTGNTIYLATLPVIAILTALYVVLKKKD